MMQTAKRDLKLNAKWGNSLYMISLKAIFLLGAFVLVNIVFADQAFAHVGHHHGAENTQEIGSNFKIGDPTDDEHQGVHPSEISAQSHHRHSNTGTICVFGCCTGMCATCCIALSALDTFDKQTPVLAGNEAWRHYTTPEDALTLPDIPPPRA